MYNVWVKFVYMKSKVINISLPEPLLKQIDHSASLSARTRSDFFRQAARSYLSNQAELDELYRYGRAQAKRLGVKTEADVAKLVTEFRAGK
ncbi:MAG: ribbon-helix-helix domain-containing protein [Candidatus Berkelbacteria bacterium]|nr:ribbon-helix-helix domain-containing protein [Candidatus Berkelbacteria bacterium]MCR4307869.1 ribbon-helix-helix domain-containing protein [Candidatus Berkelbacteria bacterium]